MQPPEFWRSDNGLARLLEPLGQLVGAMAARRLRNAKPLRVAAPVICVGNLTVGGTGKTPVANDIAARLSALGRMPAILLRGYGRKTKGVIAVDPRVHTVDDVGDEALLHARAFPAFVGRKRDEAAKTALTAGADVLVMDDGHQHGRLAKDLSLVLVDGINGFGNGRILPAGPLRESINAGLARADAVVLMGEDPRGLAGKLKERLPVLKARLAPGPQMRALRGQRVVAFAGIGDPGKFFRALNDVGAQVVARHPFDDHYVFESADIQPILDEAYELGALAVTTAKDAVRLSPDQRQQVNVMDVAVAWEDEAALERLLEKAISA